MKQEGIKMKTYMKIIKIMIIVLMAIFYMSASTAAQEKKTTVDENKKSAQTMYDEARRLMYRKNWNAAIKGYTKILEKFPASEYAVRAYYWLAYSLYNSDLSMESPERMLNSHKKAISHLETLMKQYPSSRYFKNAKLLKVEIAENLVNKGFKEFKKYIENGATKDDDIDIKISAIESLIHMDKKKAFPILEKILRSTDNDPRLRRKALFVLSQTNDSRVIPLLKDIALKDKDREIREKAIFWLGQIGGENAQDELLNLYHALGDTKDDQKLKAKLIFSIAQLNTDESVKQMISIYKKEKSLKVKKKIIFWLGQSGRKEALEFIQGILFDK
jgi:tetratricopeptide (TPR) repeat protein